METRYNTSRNYMAVWWTLGAIAVLVVLWLAFRNVGGNNPMIPNTGVDQTASSTNILNNASASTTNTMSPDAKG